MAIQYKKGIGFTLAEVLITLGVIGVVAAVTLPVLITNINEKVQKDACAKAITEQLQFSKTQKGVPSTLWIPMEGLGSAMITGKQSGNFDIAAQLKACVAAIEKTK